MKKFSTTARFLALASLFTSITLYSATANAAPRCAFLQNAPDQHKVVKGDTLWDISGKFLEHPWCWPQVWDINRDHIRDPHWIYPGQIVYFDRAAGRLRLGSAIGKGGVPTVRVSPRVRTEGLDAEAIPAIPAALIEPFLLQPLIVEEDELKDAPRIVATSEQRVYLAKNDRAYVRGNLKDDTLFQVFRPGQPLKDPVTKKVIGYESAYLGTIKLDRAAKEENEAHSFTVVSSKEEMGEGDRLLPVPPTPLMNYIPHPPEQPIDAHIVSIYGGVEHGGQNQVVTINRGINDGMAIGNVLQLYRAGRVIADRTDNKKLIKLPEEKYGTVFIFRLFNNISYGLVMQVTDAVKVGDVAKSPE